MSLLIQEIATKHATRRRRKKCQLVDLISEGSCIPEPANWQAKAKKKKNQQAKRRNCCRHQNDVTGGVALGYGSGLGAVQMKLPKLLLSIPSHSIVSHPLLILSLSWDCLLPWGNYNATESPCSGHQEVPHFFCRLRFLGPLCSRQINKLEVLRVACGQPPFPSYLLPPLTCHFGASRSFSLFPAILFPHRCASCLLWGFIWYPRTGFGN